MHRSTGLVHEPEPWPRDIPEQPLQQRLAELEFLWNEAPIGLFVCDRDYRLVRVNRNLARDIAGLPIEQCVGRSVWDLVPALRPILEPLFHRVLTAGETILKFEVQGEIPRARGITRYWEASYHPIYDENDEIVALSGIVDDITDRKLREKHLASLDARVRRLLEANLFGVVTATVDGIGEANDAFLAMIGYSREDLVGQRIDWQKITPPEHLEKDFAGLENLKATGVCPAFEKELIHKDGRRVPVLVGATLLDLEPLHWVAFVIDLSERKANEERTRELMHELTHRTKNLITVISSLAHQLAKTSGSVEEFEHRFSTRLQAMAGVHDVLMRGDWQGSGLRELVLSQLAHCAELVDRRIMLEGPAVSVTARACQYIGMALHELGTNALKYGALSGETGTVTIRWFTSADPEGLTIEWIEEGGPAVTPPTQQGFGHKVTVEMITRALDAVVSEDFHKEGLRWSVVVPSTCLLAHARRIGLQGLS